MSRSFLAKKEAKNYLRLRVGFKSSGSSVNGFRGRNALEKIKVAVYHGENSRSTPQLKSPHYNLSNVRKIYFTTGKNCGGIFRRLD